MRCHPACKWLLHHHLLLEVHLLLLRWHHAATTLSGCLLLAKIRLVSVTLRLQLCMRVWCLDEVHLKRVHIGWVIEEVKDQLGVLLMDALVIEEVGKIRVLHAHLDHLLDEGLLAAGEEIFIALVSSKRALHGKLLLNATAAFLSGGHRYNVLFLHEVEQLAWNFFKSLLRKLCWVVFELSEWHELHNVSLHVFLVAHGVKGNLVRIEDVHALEIIAANANDDDREWKRAASHDLINRLLHIVDDTVGDNQKDIVLLIGLVDVLLLCHVVDKLNDRSEVSWAVEIYVAEGVLVCLYHSVHAVDFRVEDVAVQGEAVRRTVS